MAGRRFCIVASVPAIGVPVPVEASSNLNARLGNVFVINTVPSKCQWPKRLLRFILMSHYVAARRRQPRESK